MRHDDREIGKIGGDVVEMSLGGTILGHFSVDGGFPLASAFDGTNMWFVEGGNPNVVELSPAGAMIHDLNLSPNLAGIAFDGTNMWVTNAVSNSVIELSPTGATLGTFSVGAHPVGIAFDGTHMWVTNRDDNTVTEL